MEFFPNIDDEQIDIADLLRDLMNMFQSDIQWIFANCNIDDIGCITLNVKTIGDRVIEYFTNILNGIIEGLKQAAQGLVDQVKELINKIWEYLKNPIKLVTEVWETIKSIFNTIKELITSPQKLIKIVASLIADLLSTNTTGRAFLLGSFIGAKIGEKALDWIMGGVFGFLKGVFDFILDFTKNTGKVLLKLNNLAGKTLRFGKNKIQITLKQIGNKVGLDWGDTNKLINNLDENELNNFANSIDDSISKEVLKDEKSYLNFCKLFALNKTNKTNVFVLKAYAEECFPEITLFKSVSDVLGNYLPKKSIYVDIKNQDLVNVLKNKSPGNWVKVYEAGYQDGKKIEVHYFKNIDTKESFDIKIKYEKWHQKEFKTL